MQRIVGVLNSRYCVIYAIAISIALLGIDFITGRNIRFSILYVIPVGMVAWSDRQFMAYSLAAFLPIVRLGFAFAWQDTTTFPMASINAFLRVFALMLYAYFVIEARQAIELKRQLKVLEGILPICASCKKIRGEEGEYEQMEKYISRHSEAQFSHGICPECARKLYPELYQNEK